GWRGAGRREGPHRGAAGRGAARRRQGPSTAAGDRHGGGAVPVPLAASSKPPATRSPSWSCRPPTTATPAAAVAAVLQRRPVLTGGPARLGEAEIARVVVVDGVGAGRAVPAGLQGGGAGEVAERPGVGGAGAVGAPLGEEAEGAGELAAGGGQLVGETGRAPRVGLADQDGLAFQVLETLGEDVGGDAREGLGQLVEAARALQEGLDEQQGPAGADPRPGLLHAPGRGGPGGPRGGGGGAAGPRGGRPWRGPRRAPRRRGAGGPRGRRPPGRWARGRWARGR